MGAVGRQELPAAPTRSAGLSTEPPTCTGVRSAEPRDRGRLRHVGDRSLPGHPVEAEKTVMGWPWSWWAQASTTRTPTSPCAPMVRGPRWGHLREQAGLGQGNLVCAVLQKSSPHACSSFRFTEAGPDGTQLFLTPYFII